ncbi:ribonuclease H-like domain-containing protein [Tanacetum coccineum]|uniref:Ribonuclease H-like domain-containing protein n=1 Tax=Tanacetum coccineum TaxID=301880 RepID=A0ABQ5HTQ5_9ASTR
MVVKTASWNIRGMPDTIMQDEVRSLIISNKIVSFVYGENHEKDRICLWRNLKDHKIVAGSQPWVMLGDFNVTLFDNENTNVNIRGAYGVRDFKECVDSLEMEDIPMTRVFYTWIQKIQNPGPALLIISEISSKKPRPFRFMNFLAEKLEFLDIIKKEWNAPVKGFAIKLKEELQRVQVELDINPHCAMLREEEMVYSNAYKDAMLDEERFLRQKSKIEWLKEDGKCFTGVDLADKFVEHFQKIFGVEGDTYPVDDPEIKAAIFDIEDNKAPGIDGYTSKFFKASYVTPPNWVAAE